MYIGVWLKKTHFLKEYDCCIIEVHYTNDTKVQICYRCFNIEKLKLIAFIAFYCSTHAMQYKFLQFSYLKKKKVGREMTINVCNVIWFSSPSRLTDSRWKASCCCYITKKSLWRKDTRACISINALLLFKKTKQTVILFVVMRGWIILSFKYINGSI